ncbi:MAG: nascent polypeptide-associated complex protein [archaeon]
MPGSMDPKKMQKMMKQFGIKSEEIDAEEVVIKGKDNYIVKNPQVTLIKMKGNESLQVMGDIEKSKKKEYSDEDVETVMEKAESSKEEAEKALKESKGDIADAIISLS